VKGALGILVSLLVVALICGMAMHVTGEDNKCSAVGGRLEFAANASTEECVMPDGRVVEP
jgi:putative hemolysin